MQTRQIPESEWPAFFNSFNSRHRGWVMNLEVFGPDIGAQVEGSWLVLEGVTAEYDERRGNTIMIMAGDRPADHLTHSIRRATEISLEKTDSGEDATLSIEAADGNRTLLSFAYEVLS